MDSVHLGDEDGGHSLVKSGAVHVYSGSDRDDEAGYTPVNVVVFLQTPESDGQSCSTIRKRQSYDKDTCNTLSIVMFRLVKNSNIMELCKR